MKRPAFQLYPSDWLNEAGLKLCSLAARGLWIDMICIMHSADTYGHLCAAGRALSIKDVSQMIGAQDKCVSKAMAELRRNNVFSETIEGVIYSRRMVRDEALREERASGGDRGKEFGNAGAKFGKKGGRPKNENPPFEDEKEPPLQPPLHGDENPPNIPPLKPPPSSSSSSSTSTTKEKPLRTAFAVPEWMPQNLWELYLKVRKKKRASNDPEMLAVVVEQLEELRANGHDPKSILRISVTGGWAGIFEPHGKPNGHVNGYESTKDKSRREAHEILTGKKAGNEQRTIDITPSPDLLG